MDNGALLLKFRPFISCSVSVTIAAIQGLMKSPASDIDCLSMAPLRHRLANCGAFSQFARSPIRIFKYFPTSADRALSVKIMSPAKRKQVE
jgi:hypothetical protein